MGEFVPYASWLYPWLFRPLRPIGKHGTALNESRWENWRRLAIKQLVTGQHEFRKETAARRLVNPVAAEVTGEPIFRAVV